MLHLHLVTRSSRPYRFLAFLVAGITLLVVGLTPSPVTPTAYADSSTSTAVGDGTVPADCSVNKLRKGDRVTITVPRLKVAALDLVDIPNLIDYRIAREGHSYQPK